MVISRKDVYNPRRGKVRIGRCLVCGTSVYNYRYDGFYVSAVFRDGKFIGYCHEACYNKWNPIRGYCTYCKKKVRKGNLKISQGNLYHVKCYNEVQERSSHRNQQPHYNKPTYQNPVYDVAKNVAKEALIQTTVYAVPIAREIYVAYKAADTLYSVWSDIREAYRNPDKGVYNFTTNYASSALSNVQTNIIWNAVENKIPYTMRYDAKQVLNNVISTVTDKEIEYVNQQLRYGI